MLALVLGAAAFNAPHMRPAVRGAVRVAMETAETPAEAPAPPPSPPPLEMSKSVPFLVKQKNLAGYIGEETGFDPVGLSNVLPMDWMREAELKHCRVCMLAVVGMLVPEFVTLPVRRGRLQQEKAGG